MSRRAGAPPPLTPDGRYLVVDGVLWRASNPGLGTRQRALLVEALMHARRDVGRALRTGDKDAEHQARGRVHIAKVALGERGAPWWTDGAPDLNRHHVEHTPYAGWFRTTRAGRLRAAAPGRA